MSNILKGLGESSLADQMLAFARQKNPNARLAGTPEQERERTQQMLKQREIDRANQPKPTYSPEQIESMKQQLAQAKQNFDPNYEYSDDYGHWKTQSEKAQTINSLTKTLKDAGVELEESKEADYSDEYQQMVKRVGQKAKEGPRKVVYDPVTRKYKTVPVKQPAIKQGVAEGSDDDIWGPQGNFAGDTKVDVGNVSMKKIQVGDVVTYFGEKAKVIELGSTQARISANGKTWNVRKSDLKPLGQGVTEGRENYNGLNLLLQKDDEELFVKASAGGRELGHVLFVIDGDTLSPQDLEVDERYRGQGIAKTMYDYVKSKGYKIRRSGQQTDAGKGFWAKHRPEQNVWEQGVAEAKADPTSTWVVYDGDKVKRFKTHQGAKAYAEQHGGKVASSAHYADKIQGKQGVAEGANVTSQIKRIKDRILQLKDWNTAGTHDKKIKELQTKLKELQSQKQGVAEGSLTEFAGNEKDFGGGSEPDDAWIQRKARLILAYVKKQPGMNLVKDIKIGYSFRTNTFQITGKNKNFNQTYEWRYVYHPGDEEKGIKPRWVPHDSMTSDRPYPPDQFTQVVFDEEIREQGVAEGIDNTNEFGVDFNNIKSGDKIITEPDSYTGRRSSFIVLSKARFPNGMLALKVKDKSQDKGYSLVNFLEVEKVRKQDVAEAQKQKLTVGSKVTHPEHGQGTVVMHSPGGGNMGTVVKFDNGKKVKVDHKKLSTAEQDVAEGIDDKEYRNWNEYEYELKQKAVKALEYLKEINPDMFKTYGEEFLLNVSGKISSEYPAASIMQVAGGVVRHLKQNVGEGQIYMGGNKPAGMRWYKPRSVPNEDELARKESAIMKGLQLEGNDEEHQTGGSLGTPYPTTYEQETLPYRTKGQRRTQSIAFEDKDE